MKQIESSKSIILDCDPGHDDAVAILLALGSESIDLAGVTTVFGNCKVEDATRNALDILSFAGREDIPVAAGAARPISGPAVLGNYVHGTSGLDGPELKPSTSSPVSADAVNWMAEYLRNSSAKTTIVATGPITNVARLIDEHEDVKPRISEIIFMGGSTDRGNHTPYAEFNTYADPEALEKVISSDIHTRMVGLNLTHQALATPEVVSQLKGLSSDLGDVVSAWMGFFGDSYQQIWNFSSPPVHDPCTVAALIDPSLIRWKRTFLAVETAGKFTRGATVADLDGRWPEYEPNVDVALRLDNERYWNLVISAVAALGEPTHVG